MRLMAVLLMIVALLTTGCSWPGAKPGDGSVTTPLPTGEPLLTGTITKIEGGRILVETAPSKQEEPKCWLALEKSTVVAVEKDGKALKAAASALAVGQVVKAWASGPVLKSYPCQGGAQAILIIE